MFIVNSRQKLVVVSVALGLVLIGTVIYLVSRYGAQEASPISKTLTSKLRVSVVEQLSDGSKQRGLGYLYVRGDCPTPEIAANPGFECTLAHSSSSSDERQIDASAYQIDSLAYQSFNLKRLFAISLTPKSFEAQPIVIAGGENLILSLEVDVNGITKLQRLTNTGWEDIGL